LRDACDLVAVMRDVRGHVGKRAVGVHPETYRVMEDSG
jgi:hypothetical protein